MAATYRKSTSSRHSASARSVPPTGSSLASTGKGNITLNVPYRSAFALARQSSTQGLTPLSGSSSTSPHHCSTSLPGRLLERCRAQFTGRHKQLSIILDGFRCLGIPIATDKALGPSQVLPLLGVELDTVLFEARLPADKLREIKDPLQQLLGANHTTYGFLETFLGKLSFASRVVVQSFRLEFRRLAPSAQISPDQVPPFLGRTST